MAPPPVVWGRQHSQRPVAQTTKHSDNEFIDLQLLLRALPRAPEARMTVVVATMFIRPVAAILHHPQEPAFTGVGLHWFALACTLQVDIQTKVRFMIPDSRNFSGREQTSLDVQMQIYIAFRSGSPNPMVIIASCRDDICIFSRKQGRACMVILVRLNILSFRRGAFEKKVPGHY